MNLNPQLINKICQDYYEDLFLQFSNLKQQLDIEALIKIITIIKNCSGKVIFCGVGKSGHIAKRAAASFSSTGISSFFVHACEASHGDLGMITANDVVFFISYSGNSSELKDPIHYTKKINCSTIGISSQSDSYLALNTTAFLKIPNITETTKLPAPFFSTNILSIYVDLINVLLIQEKEFSHENYKHLHPAGMIGFNLLQVKDIMHIDKELPLVQQHQLMHEVLLEITSKRFGCAGVLDENQELLGVITDGDIRRHMTDNFLQLKAYEVMTANPKVLNQNEYLVDVLNKFTITKITNAFVVHDQKIIGILHIHDILQKNK